MKCAVGIRQVLGVAFGYDDFRMGAAGNANHRGRKVQTVRTGAARRRGSGEMAWSARHVEHMLTGRNFSGFHQRCNVGRCRLSKTVSVARGGPLPAGMLKGADGFGFKTHKSAPGLENSATAALKQIYRSVSRYGVSR